MDVPYRHIEVILAVPGAVTRTQTLDPWINLRRGGYHPIKFQVIEKIRLTTWGCVKPLQNMGIHG